MIIETPPNNLVGVADSIITKQFEEQNVIIAQNKVI